MPMSQVIAKMSKYRLDVDPNKIIAPVTSQFTSYDLVPFANAADFYALTVSRSMVFPVATPAAEYTGSYLLGAFMTGNTQEISDFGQELLGIPGDSYAPTSFGGVLGAGWHNAIAFSVQPGKLLAGTLTAIVLANAG